MDMVKAMVKVNDMAVMVAKVVMAVLSMVLLLVIAFSIVYVIIIEYLLPTTFGDITL